MKKQGYNDRLDERLGMIDGAERNFKQSYKDRRDESRGERRRLEEDRRDRRDERREDRRDDRRDRRDERRFDRSNPFDLRDNEQAWIVKRVPTDNDRDQLDRIEEYRTGNKGYPREAF